MWTPRQRAHPRSVAQAVQDQGEGAQGMGKASPLHPYRWSSRETSEQGSSKHLSVASKPAFGYPKDKAPTAGVGFAVPATGKRRRRAKGR